MNYKTYYLILVLVFLFFVLGIFCVVYKINSFEQQKEVRYNLTPEQESELLCPFKCIDAGYQWGKYLKLTNTCVANNCFCYNQTK